MTFGKINNTMLVIDCTSHPVHLHSCFVVKQTQQRDSSTNRPTASAMQNFKDVIQLSNYTFCHSLETSVCLTQRSCTEELDHVIVMLSICCMVSFRIWSLWHTWKSYWRSSRNQSERPDCSQQQCWCGWFWPGYASQTATGNICRFCKMIS